MTDEDLREEVRRLRTEMASLQDRLLRIEDELDVDDAGRADRDERQETGGGAEETGTSTETAAAGVDESDEAPVADEPPDREERRADRTTSSDEDAEAHVSDATTPRDGIPSPLDDGDVDVRPFGDESPSDVEEPPGAVESAGVQTDSGQPTPADDGSTVAAGRDETWEVAVGSKWLGVVGALAVVVGVVFFVRYAIDAGWIGYRGRVLLGVLTGVVMTAGGRHAVTRRRYERWGKIVTGGGVAVTYFSVYAAYHFEAYREAFGASLGATVAVLSLIVAAAAGLSLADDSQLVAGEAFLFGFLTAAMSLELGALTLVYVLLLAAAIAALTYAKPWLELSLGGFVGTYVVYSFWAVDQGDPLVQGSLFLVAAFGCFLAATFLLSDHDRALERWPGAGISVLAVVNAMTFAILLNFLLLDQSSAVRAVPLLALSGVHVGVFVGTERLTRRRSAVAPYLSVLFLAGATVVALSGLQLTVAVAGIVVGVVALSLRFDAPPFRYAAHGIAVLLTTKVVLVDPFELPSFTLDAPLAANRLFAVLFAVAAFAAVARLLWIYDSRLAPFERREQLPAAVAYAWVATVLLAGIVAAELGGYFWMIVVGSALVVALTIMSDRVGVAVPRYTAHGFAVGVAFHVLLFGPSFPAFDPRDPVVANRPLAFLVVVATFYLLYATVLSGDRDWGDYDRHPVVGRGTTYAWGAALLVTVLLGVELSSYRVSVAWALYAFGLLGAGIRTGARELRLQALSLFGLVTFKVFLVDTGQLDAPARVLSFLALGVVLLIASFAYARYADRIAAVVGD